MTQDTICSLQCSG